MDASLAPLRILFLSPFAPRLDADHGGGRVMAQLLLAIADRHRVGLLYLRAPYEPELDPVLRERCEIVGEVIRPDSRGDGPFSIAFRIRSWVRCLGGRPHLVARWHAAAVNRHLEVIAREWRPDLVQVEYHLMGQYLSALRNSRAPRILIEHEPGVPAARERWSRALGLRRLALRWDLAAWRRFEPALLGRVQAVVAFTERDRAALLAEAPRAHVVRIPLGTPFPEQPLDPLGQSPLSLLFVGNFLHQPNVDAACWLATSILPAVLARHPDTVLYLVGDRPPPVVRSLGGSRVVVTGRVPDVTPYLDRAAVVVLPLRLGGGMRVKALEALAAGKAVVATPLALEGLEVRPGVEVGLGRSAEDLAQAIGDLLADPAARRRLAANGRQWARANLGWDRVVAQYDNLYRSLAGA